MSYEETVTHMETYKNRIVEVINKAYPESNKAARKEWITWLKMELEVDFGLRKRGEVLKDLNDA